MAKIDELFEDSKNDDVLNTDATKPADVDKPATDEPVAKEPVPDTTHAASDNDGAETPESPSNPQIDQPQNPPVTPPEPGQQQDQPAPNVPGKLPDHGVENENEDVVKDASQKQFIHQALVYTLRAAKELAQNVKVADTKYSTVANELDQFLAGHIGKVESVQSDVPVGAGADSFQNDPTVKSHVKI